MYFVAAVRIENSKNRSLRQHLNTRFAVDIPDDFTSSTNFATLGTYMAIGLPAAVPTEELERE